MRRRDVNVKPVFAWAWVIFMGSGKPALCYFASPSRDQLLRDGKPSPEAVAIRVEIRPARKAKAPTCGQCGKSFSARACGPTHALVWNEKRKAKAKRKKARRG